MSKAFRIGWSVVKGVCPGCGGRECGNCLSCHKKDCENYSPSTERRKGHCKE